VNGTAGTTRPYYPATTYWYKVSAVDTQGNESPLSTTQSYWVYHNGVFGWGGNLSYGATMNFTDTVGVPESGAADIACTLLAGNGGCQPYSGLNTTTWNMWGGAFKYLKFDIKPMVNNETFLVSFLIAGDVTNFNSGGHQLIITIGGSAGLYGPAPVVGKWATYTIPLTDVVTDYGSSGAGPPALEYAIYKFFVADQSNILSTWYLDNVQFTP